MVDGEVTVEYGVNSTAMAVVGKTIAQVIEIARKVWVLPENLEAELNEDPTSDFSTVLEDGDELQLIKPSGDKGL